jgi:hypothetical protein
VLRRAQTKELKFQNSSKRVGIGLKSSRHHHLDWKRMDPGVTGQTGQADEDSQPREKRDWGFADLDDACSKVPLRVEADVEGRCASSEWVHFSLSWRIARPTHVMEVQVGLGRDMTHGSGCVACALALSRWSRSLGHSNPLQFNKLSST